MISHLLYELGRRLECTSLAITIVGNSRSVTLARVSEAAASTRMVF